MLTLRPNKRQHFERWLLNSQRPIDARSLLQDVRSWLPHPPPTTTDEIYSLSLAGALPTLPFEVFRKLLCISPLHTDDGVLLRRLCIDMGAMHLVLNCLGIFTHHSQQLLPVPGLPTATSSTTAAAATAGAASTTTNGGTATTPGGEIAADNTTASVSDDKGHMYWAKGTGFGTGSTTKSWDVEQALQRQRTEEEHVTIFLQVLSGYINPEPNSEYDRNRTTSGSSSNADDDGNNYQPTDDSTDDDSRTDRIFKPASLQRGPMRPPQGQRTSGGESSDGNLLPAVFHSLLQQSCLIPALCSYLRNDSVLDITRHIPLYRAILQLLRGLAQSNQLVTLLLPPNHRRGNAASGSLSITALLANMKSCVDTYASRLK